MIFIADNGDILPKRSILEPLNYFSLYISSKSPLQPQISHLEIRGDPFLDPGMI